MPENRLRIFFDGGCRPNPGPIEIAAVARGIVYVERDVATGGCQEAEWLALIHAVRIAIALGAQDVEFVGDSTTVVHQASGRWACRDAALRGHRATFTALVAGIGRVRLLHVSRTKNLAGIALAKNHPR